MVMMLQLQHHDHAINWTRDVEWCETSSVAFRKHENPDTSFFIPDFFVFLQANMLDW